jgi:hypothetical protein
MKKTILSLAFIAVLCQLASAQLKVVSGNNVSIGYSWLSGQTEKLSVLGRSYFKETPALSGLSIGNYPYNSSFNATTIIPQWNNSTLLGTSTERFFEAHVSYIYYLNLYSLSDQNLKTNIQPIKSNTALDGIKRINAYTYDFKPIVFKNAQKEIEPLLLESGKNQIGIMAQELKMVFPQLVKQDEKTQQLSVNYIGLIPILIESIKEQQRQIEDLKLLVSQLQQR